MITLAIGGTVMMSMFAQAFVSVREPLPAREGHLLE
jgi:hypothetical protein